MTDLFLCRLLSLHNTNSAKETRMLQPDQTNQILSALPRDDYDRLAQGFERVGLVYDADI